MVWAWTITSNIEHDTESKIDLIRATCLIKIRAFRGESSLMIIIISHKNFKAWDLVIMENKNYEEGSGSRELQNIKIQEENIDSMENFEICGFCSWCMEQSTVKISLVLLVRMPTLTRFPLLGLELEERERESLRESSPHEISSSLASPPGPATLGNELGPAMGV